MLAAISQGCAAPVEPGPAAVLPTAGLRLDLDPAFGLQLEEGHRVAAWTNRIESTSNRVFVKQDKGRREAGSGRPTHVPADAALGGQPTVVFRGQELVLHDEDAFDALLRGGGYTWITVVRPLDQTPGLKDVNTIFGNLRSGGNFEGIWANFTDDNRVWTGARNGKTFGRFDANNPMVLGPKLETGRYHLLASRLPEGTQTVTVTLYANSLKPVAESPFPVNPEANASKMVVGQERDAFQHPGHEAFDGAIARLLIWDRPLPEDEFAAVMRSVARQYGIHLAE